MDRSMHFSSFNGRSTFTIILNPGEAIIPSIVSILIVAFLGVEMGDRPLQMELTLQAL